ncbi:MAG: DUF2067 family protein [Ignisphaera sp.]
MGGVFIERTFSYSCPSRTLCLELLEKIDEELSLEAELFAELKHDKIVFRVVGLEPYVESAIKKIREYISQFMMIKSINPRNGVSAEQLAKLVRRTIPLDVLAEVLRRQGVRNIILRGSIIYADTDLETIEMFAQHIAKAFDRVSNAGYSYNLKKLIVAAVALYNIGESEVLDMLSEINAIDDKLELKVPWQEALKYIEERLIST